MTPSRGKFFVRLSKRIFGKEVGDPEAFRERYLYIVQERLEKQEKSDKEKALIEVEEQK